jgi:DNA-binding MarR family transcriptional regulator
MLSSKTPIDARLKLLIQYNLTKAEYLVFLAIMSKAEEMHEKEEDSFKKAGIILPQHKIAGLSKVSISSVRNCVSSLQKKKIIKIKKYKKHEGSLMNSYFLTPKVCKLLQI